MLIPPNITTIAAALLSTTTPHVDTASSVSAHVKIAAKPETSDDGTCGPYTLNGPSSGRNLTCEGSTFGPACARSGKCGWGPEYAGGGCQTEFGACGLNYTTYVGDGSQQAGWPTRKQWITFEDMWQLNYELLGSGCPEGTAQNSYDELESLRSAILATSKSADGDIDSRFMLAIILQESTGCVRKSSVQKKGLLQTNSKNDPSCSSSGTCPSATIFAMVKAGAVGTDLRTLQGALEGYKNYHDLHYAPKYYRAARIYDSRNVSDDGNLGRDDLKTEDWACYASDIANRVLGWNKAHSTEVCDVDAARSGLNRIATSASQSITGSTPSPYATSATSATSALTASPSTTGTTTPTTTTSSTTSSTTLTLGDALSVFLSVCSAQTLSCPTVSITSSHVTGSTSGALPSTTDSSATATTATASTGTSAVTTGNTPEAYSSASSGSSSPGSYVPATTTASSASASNTTPSSTNTSTATITPSATTTEGGSSTGASTTPYVTCQSDCS